MGVSSQLFRIVMRGLDPRIHLQKHLFKMDCRVKPGNDIPALCPGCGASRKRQARCNVTWPAPTILP
jgi:hypothetical protein